MSILTQNAVIVFLCKFFGMLDQICLQKVLSQQLNIGGHNYDE